MSIRLLTMCFLFRQCLERNPIVRLNINASRKHDYFSAVYVLLFFYFLLY